MNTTIKQVGWCITGTHDDGDDKRIGYGQGVEQADQTQISFDNIVGRTIYMDTDLKPDAIPFDKRVKWRSFSDDGEPAYDGVIHINWLYAPAEWPEEHQDLAYNVDRFNMEDWGATVVLYNAADIRRCRPDLAEYIANHTRINPKSEAGKWFLSNAKVDPQAWVELYG